MKISARVNNNRESHRAAVATNNISRSIQIPPKAIGYGSSVNGGELLLLALATCYCNDIYREAAKRNIIVNKVEVEVEGEFGGEGVPAKNITYNAKVAAGARDEEIRDLMEFVDKVAEIQNTLRMQTTVTLSKYEIIE